jgi:hypothetical protein
MGNALVWCNGLSLGIRQLNDVSAPLNDVVEHLTVTHASNLVAKQQISN